MLTGERRGGASMREHVAVGSPTPSQRLRCPVFRAGVPSVGSLRWLEAESVGDEILDQGDWITSNKLPSGSARTM